MWRLTLRSETADFPAHAGLKSAAWRSFKSRTVPLAIVCSLLAISGCGGGDETDQTAAPPPAPPKPAPVAVPAETEDEKPAVAKPAAGRPAPRTNRPAAKPLTPEEAQHAFVAYVDQPNYTVLDDIEREQHLQQSQETVKRPGVGQNSSSFVVEQRPQQNSGTRDPRLQLPANYVELPEYGYDASGWPKRIQSNRVDQTIMAFIPAGVFIQGKNDAGEKVGPQISAYLGPYYIDIHEVTLENFNKFRMEVSNQGDRPPEEPANAGGDPREPAVGVLWRDAGAYAEALGKELPTEAEWEKAARGASGFDHPWGYGRPAYRKERSLDRLAPVMSYPTDQSYYGVYDMAGNAREWCADWYAPDSYEQALEAFGQVPRNWEGPRKAEPQFHRVIKGNGPDWTVWARDGASMSDRVHNVGFRCVLRVPDAN